MMKKVLYGVALTLLAGASVGSLTSCKDDLEDYKTQTSYDLKDLEFLINQKLADLQSQINGKQDADDYALLSDLDDYAKLSYLHKLIFGSEVKDLTGQDLQDLNDIIAKGGLYDMIKGAVSSCDCEKYADIVKLLFPDPADQPSDYGTNTNMISYLNGKIGANKASIDEILKFLNGYIYDADGNPISGTEGYKTLAELLNKINGDIDALAGPEGRVTKLESKVADLIDVDIAELKSGVSDLKEDVADLIKKDAAISSEVNDILAEVQKIENTYLQAINDRIDNLITSIKVERAISPVFGDFSVPVGVHSNILFNWYGLSDNGSNVPFPTDIAGLVGDGITLPANAPSSINIVEGENGYFGEDVELGDVYVTVNPIGHMFDGTKLTLTTSAGNNLDFDVTLTPSQYELKHGINNTRAASEVGGNGFYEGKVTVPNAKVESIKLSLDEKLQTAMKNVVKDQTKRNAASLIKAIYDQLSDVMPAYALRYDWTSKYYNGDASMKDETVGEGDDATTVQVPDWKSDVYQKGYAVLSGYDLGVAAARPLGFNFLKGEGASSDKVPTIGKLDNFVQELIDKNLKDLKIEGKDMEVLGHTIGFAEGEVSINTVDNLLVATVKGVTVDGKAIGDVKSVGFTDPSETSAYINKALSKAIADVISDNKDVNSDAYKQVQAKVEATVDIALLQMQKQINEVLEDVDGQIHKAFNGMGNSAQSYINKANRAIDLYNKVANKINSFLKNPNHYLQAAAFYASSNNIGILSSNPSSPTEFKGSGDAITLYLSTYTGEIIAPAYKKYVAVTTPGATALNTGDLNKVLPGSQIEVEVNISNFEANKVYELTYQAVDYRGFYSTRKCYIKVVKN